MHIYAYAFLAYNAYRDMHLAYYAYFRNAYLCIFSFAYFCIFFCIHMHMDIDAYL